MGMLVAEHNPDATVTKAIATTTAIDILLKPDATMLRHAEGNNARLLEVFTFLQKHLKDSGVDLHEVEYAACNGMLRTLDPHSAFLSPDAYREMNLSPACAGWIASRRSTMNLR